MADLRGQPHHRRPAHQPPLRGNASSVVPDCLDPHPLHVKYRSPMQVVHCIIASAVVFSPSPPAHPSTALAKTLFAFGYFPFYEYGNHHPELFARIFAALARCRDPLPAAARRHFCLEDYDAIAHAGERLGSWASRG